jgi:hypothetical protein
MNHPRYRRLRYGLIFLGLTGVSETVGTLSPD